jgi:hypothetical protein
LNLVRGGSNNFTTYFDTVKAPCTKASTVADGVGKFCKNIQWQQLINKFRNVGFTQIKYPERIKLHLLLTMAMRRVGPDSVYSTCLMAPCKQLGNNPNTTEIVASAIAVFFGENRMYFLSYSIMKASASSYEAKIPRIPISLPICWNMRKELFFSWGWTPLYSFKIIFAVRVIRQQLAVLSPIAVLLCQTHGLTDEDRQNIEIIRVGDFSVFTVQNIHAANGIQGPLCKSKITQKVWEKMK